MLDEIEMEFVDDDDFAVGDDDDDTLPRSCSGRCARPLRHTSAQVLLRPRMPVERNRVRLCARARSATSTWGDEDSRTHLSRGEGR